MHKLVCYHGSPVSNFSVRKGIYYPFLLLLSVMIATLLACGGSGAIETAPPVSEQETAPPVSGSQVEYTPGDHALSLVYDGVERTYVLHIPTGFDPFKPVALVLVFHGYNLDANEMIRISGFNSQSDASGFIVVYPEGTGADSSWNGGHCCGTAARDNVDDVGFVRTLIVELTNSLPIDPKQIYATGFSNGSIFTYRLACELSDLIASFGPISATPAELDLEVCAPERPVPVIYFHGTADEANPYDGGELASGYYFLPVSDTIGFFVDFNGCPAQPQTTTSGSIQHDVYAPCDSGSTVELFTIEGGMHAWPGGEAVNQKMGEPNMEISATTLMWEFFRSHPMP